MSKIYIIAIDGICVEEEEIDNNNKEMATQ